MSQTLGVGFAVRFLQSWFIIIIVNAILECKLWYYKAKVIHLWSVKCQMIFFLKREEPCWQTLGRRQRAEPRGKARCCGAAARHGVLSVRRRASQAQPCGRWCFRTAHSRSATALSSCLCGGPVWGCSHLVVCCLWYLWCGLLTTALQVMEVLMLVNCFLKQTLLETLWSKNTLKMLRSGLKVYILIARELLKYLSAAICKFMKSLIWFLWYTKSPVTNPTITCFLMSTVNTTDLPSILSHKKITLCC